MQYVQRNLPMMKTVHQILYSVLLKVTLFQKCTKRKLILDILNPSEKAVTELKSALPPLPPTWMKYLMWF